MLIYKIWEIIIFGNGDREFAFDFGVILNDSSSDAGAS